MNIKRDYHVRDIMALPKNERWELPDGGINLTFDNDVTIKAPTRKVIMASYYWSLFDVWPGGIITEEHFFNEKFYAEDSHKKLATKVFWDVFFGHHPNYLCGEGQKTIWEMSRYIYQVSNEIFNDTISMLGEYPVSMDIEDIVDILEQPEVVEAKQAYRDGKKTVEDTHDAVFAAIVNEDIPNFHINPVRLGMMSGGLNRRQATQITGPRAFVPDVNGVSPETPIYEGYADGLNNNYSRIRDSRAASISLYSTSGPLETSEYNNRMCQLLCSIIRGVDYGDCGGEYTLKWLVEKETLKSLRGKVAIIDGENVVLWGNEEHLIGEVISLRSILTCNSKDPTRPCSHCLGLQSLTLPPHANLGHYLTIDPLGKISQTILSMKHVIASTKTFQLDINYSNAKYLRLEEGHRFNAFLNEFPVINKLNMRIHTTEARFLNDIYAVDDVKQLNPTRITSLNHIQLVEYTKNGTIRNTVDLNVSVSGKGTSFTHEFLEFLKAQELDVISRDKIEFSIQNWDHKKPFLITPRVGEDITALLSKVEAFIHSRNDAKTPRAIDHATREGAIQDLLMIMLSKIEVNFAHVEVFVRALMARGETSYQLPLPTEPFRFIRLKEAIQMRGLGASLAFEGQPDRILKPNSYTRMDDSIPGTELDWQVS